MIIICAIIAVLFAADYWMNAGKIYRGVEVGGIALGGMTEREAREALQERSSGALDEITVSNPTGGEDFTFTPESVGIDYNLQATVDRAYAVGREGGLGQRFLDRIETAYGTISVEPEYDYDPASAQERVDEIAATLDSARRDASVEIVGSAVDVSGSSAGYQTDQRATLEAINDSVEDMSGESTVQGSVLRPELTTEEAQRAAEKARAAMNGELEVSGGGENWTISPSAIGSTLVISEQSGDFRVEMNRDAMLQNLQPVYASLQQPAVEAGYDVNGTEVSVTPGQRGQEIQGQRLLDEMQSAIFTGQRAYNVPLVVDRPQLTTAQAEAMKPTELLGEYSTNYLTYDDTPGRVDNLQIGSGAVDGQLVAPGEVFSFNALAADLDYKSGSVIVDGQVDTADGGGLCQVSSTLYMAANYAGLDVVERHPHFAELPYIRPGFDATVWFGENGTGELDMKFRNNTDGYILIKESVNTQTGDVNASIYGVPQNVDVDMSSTKVSESGSGKTLTTKWVTYQTISRNGEIVYDGVLHTDTYDYLKPEDS